MKSDFEKLSVCSEWPPRKVVVSTPTSTPEELLILILGPTLKTNYSTNEHTISKAQQEYEEYKKLTEWMKPIL